MSTYSIYICRCRLWVEKKIEHVVLSMNLIFYLVKPDDFANLHILINESPFNLTMLYLDYRISLWRMNMEGDYPEFLKQRGVGWIKL